MLRNGLATPGGRFPGSVVDLCCGSAAVGVAIASKVPGVELYAADIDPVAVNCGRRNVAQVGGQICQGDLYSALPARLKGRVQLLAVNAPYVPTEAFRTMPPEARNYEPRVSLDGSADGYLVIETSERQVAGTAALMVAARFSAVIHAGVVVVV